MDQKQELHNPENSKGASEGEVVALEAELLSKVGGGDVGAGVISLPR